MYSTTVFSRFCWRRPAETGLKAIRNGSFAPEPTSAGASPVRAFSSVRKSLGMNGFVTGTGIPVVNVEPAVIRGDATWVAEFSPGAVKPTPGTGAGASPVVASYSVQFARAKTSTPAPIS